MRGSLVEDIWEVYAGAPDRLLSPIPPSKDAVLRCWPWTSPRSMLRTRRTRIARGIALALAIAGLLFSLLLALSGGTMVKAGLAFNLLFGIPLPTSLAATGFLMALPTIYAAALWPHRRFDLFWIGLALILTLACLVSLYVLFSPLGGISSPSRMMR
jgi:Mn2+/Fe2+ NRAMP family transporter